MTKNKAKPHQISQYIVITGKHPHNGQVFEVKEWRENGWVLTSDDHLFHQDFFDPYPSPTLSAFEPSHDGNFQSCKGFPQLSASADPEILHLQLSEIRRDGGTQPRAKIDLTHIKRLCDQIEDGQEIEPIIVFFDGESYWLADGFHRWHAHKNQEEPTIGAYVHQGSRRDAVLYSVGANADHKPALPRTHADKRRAVLTLLNDPEWQQWSDREIARQCNVSDRTVNRLRQSICDNDADTKVNTRKVRRGEQEYTVDTTNIGKTQIEPDTEPAFPKATNPEKSQIEVTTETHQVADPPQKLEINTDDILIAFLSNLDYLSEEQVEAAFKAIAQKYPEMLKRSRE